LIEGRIAKGPYRLGSDGLIELVLDALGNPPFTIGGAHDDALLDRLIDQVRDLNSGELDDDIAILALSRA
jgi:hypothetical protein